MVLTVLAVVTAVTFIGTGGVKLFSVPMSLAIRDSLDVEPTLWKRIGTLEWLGAAGVLVGLAWEPLGVLASLGLAALIVGAIATRIRAARRHQRSEAVGLALDTSTLVLTLACAVAFTVGS